MYDSVQNNTWLFFRLLLFEFLFFMNHLSRRFTHKRISRFCICSLKNVLHVIYCLVINVHLLSATAFIYYHLLLSLSTTFFNFFWFVFAISKKALKTHLFCWFVVAVFSNLGYYTPWSRQKSTPFFKIFSKWQNKQNPQFSVRKLWILHKNYCFRSNAATKLVLPTKVLKIASSINILHCVSENSDIYFSTFFSLLPKRFVALFISNGMTFKYSLQYLLNQMQISCLIDSSEKLPFPLILSSFSRTDLYASVNIFESTLPFKEDMLPFA